MNRSVRLYTPLGVAVGTLLGSLAAGAVLLWLNYRALGYRQLANKVAAGGLVLYLVIVLTASVLPDSRPLGMALVAAQTLLAYWAARLLQGEAVGYHLARGATAQSNLRAAGVGLLTGAAAVLVLLVVTSLLGLPVVQPTSAPGSAG